MSSQATGILSLESGSPVSPPTCSPNLGAGTGSEGLILCQPSSCGQGQQLPVLWVGLWQGQEAPEGSATARGTDPQRLSDQPLPTMNLLSSKPLRATPSEDRLLAPPTSAGPSSLSSWSHLPGGGRQGQAPCHLRHKGSRELFQ